MAYAGYLRYSSPETELVKPRDHFAMKGSLKMNWSLHSQALLRFLDF